MSKKLVVIIIPATRKRETDAVLHRYRKHTEITVRGMASVINFGSIFGFADDKRLLQSVILEETAATELLSLLETEYGFNKQNAGVAFTVNLDGIIGYTPNDIEV